MKSESLFAGVLRSPLIPPLKRRLEAGDFLSLNSVSDAGQPFVAALLAQLSNRPILIVTNGLKSQEAFFNDLQTFLPAAQFYPAWETLPHEDQLPHAATITDRLKVLADIVGRVTPGSAPDSPRGVTRPTVIVASVQALMQRTFSPSSLHALRLSLACGQPLDLQEFSDRLLALGYHPEFQVSERGDLAVRGGIVDFFPLDRDLPVRVELAGDTVESIRSFDPVTQQSQEKLESLAIAPAGELGLLKQSSAPLTPLVDLLPADTLLVLAEPESLLLAADQYARQIPADDRFFVAWQHTLNSGKTLVQLTEAIALDPPDGYFNLRLASLDAYRPLDTRAPVPEIAETVRGQFFAQMQRWVTEDYRLHVLCSTAGERQRFEELWAEFTIGRGPHPPISSLDGGGPRGRQSLSRTSPAASSGRTRNWRWSPIPKSLAGTSQPGPARNCTRPLRPLPTGAKLKPVITLFISSMASGNIWD